MLDSCHESDDSRSEYVSPMDPAEQSQPELIAFYEVADNNIKQILQDVPYLSDFRYPYEYHLTMGIFSDESPDVLRLWAEATVDFLFERASADDRQSMRVTIDRASRSDHAGRGFRFLFSDGPESGLLMKINKDLASFMEDNGVSISSNMHAYLPHVTFTPAFVKDDINFEQEEIIIKIINEKILSRGLMAKDLTTLDIVAARSIIKYEDKSGKIIKEIWERSV